MRARSLSLPLLWACLLLSCGSNPVVYRDSGNENGGRGGTTAHNSGTGGTSLDVNNGGAPPTGSTGVEADCGNGVLEPGELCDDGDTEDGDGCSADCLEPDEDYACLEPGEPCVRVVICGSGVIEGDETCDDGNNESGDGCAADCSVVEDGWVCPRPGRDCVESPECGNGALERGETCDDNNTASGDGCTGTEEADDSGCQLEDGYWCPGAGEDCVALVCGDGNRTSDEACDDHNTESEDGCSSTCAVEAGWRCSTHGCNPVCGDGTILGSEDCDDANRTSGDGCSAACRVEPFWDCDGVPSVCTSTIECGNEVLDPGEICDPPAEDTGCIAGCESFAPVASTPSDCGNSVVEAGEACDPPGTGCTEACQVEAGFTCPRPGTCMLLSVCGNGLKQVGEGCDVGPEPSAGCVDCQITTGWSCWGLEPSVCALRSCGDGTRQLDEDCDDGNDEGGDGCSPECIEEAGWHCSSTGCASICGDGVVVDQEDCDDGNVTSGDGCSAACFTEPFFACTGEPSECGTTIACGNNEVEPGEICDPPSEATGCLAGCRSFAPDAAAQPQCNNSVIEAGESCDPPTPAEGCDENCQVEEGYVCPRPGVCHLLPVCGNGTREASEGCDVGDAESEGCMGCQVTDGWTCYGLAPSVCEYWTCGDGQRTSGEECDYAIAGSAEGCSTSCTVNQGWRCSNTGCRTICGDGIVVADAEECDNANRTSGDGCSAACTVEPFWDCEGAPSVCTSTIECGNEVLDPGEICDPPAEDTGCIAGCKSFAPEASVPSVCGNWVIEAGETCDPPGTGCGANCAVLAGYTCPRPGTCMLLPVCGDGAKQVGEGCDVGSEPSAGCVDCQITTGWTCWGLQPSVCALWSCQDGTRQRGEDCDDGNDETGDGCSPTCTEEIGWHCSSTGCASDCGDGLVVDEEDCDDGNVTSGDGCSAACFLEPFYACTGEPSECETTITCGNNEVEPGEICDPPSVTTGCLAGCESFAPKAADPPVCGNSLIEAGETCDPPAVGSGCAEDCQVEGGYFCPRPGVCFPLPNCGDGTREVGEECDVGTTPSDGCIDCQVQDDWTCFGVEPSVCENWYCGDGLRTPGEKCDDGSVANGDGCSDTCTVEAGWRCSSSGCKAICGDGLVVSGEEECDDHNAASGDGCSAACVEEPFFDCTNAPGEPSVCTSTIECGNGLLEPGEICDPPSTDTGCLAGCADFAPDSGNLAVCGNAVIELGEQCEPPSLIGCSDTCQVEAGYVCPRPGVCTALPVCGNGLREVGEGCDDGSAGPGDGCVNCQVTAGWVCVGVQPTVCQLPVCGDGVRQYGEECDDNDAVTEDDGCTEGCTVQEGWVCPYVGEPCWAICGDALIVGDEECDDDDVDNDDGCNAACRVEPGWSCPSGEPCVEAECGNAAEVPDPEPGEACDDGNLIAGDGCGPTCQIEPTITPGPNPVVDVFCGDGMVTGDEECDDGNAESGDGCSGTEDTNPTSHCREEPGFTCTADVDYPASVEFAVTLRDFIARNGNPSPYQNHGHPDFQWVAGNLKLGIPGPACTTSNKTACAAAAGATCPAGTCGVLDVAGKPALHLTGANLTPAYITSAATYALWYRDTNDASTTGQHGVIDMCHVGDSLRLAQVGGTSSDVYQYSKVASGINGHFPLGSRCFGYYENSRNYHFTTELRYFFQYRGGETLSFLGDDDVWVFINGRLAVDIGGLHSARYGRVVLGDDGDGGTDSNCSAHGPTAAPADCTLEAGEIASVDDKRFGLDQGGVYEIVLFHAERYTADSNFQLTLAGFLPPRSYCSPDCGDGIVAGWEVCDDGEYDADDEEHNDEGEYNSDAVYGACNTSCTMRTFCGDGVPQGSTSSPVSGTEECDNGRNIDFYSTGAPDECAPGCVLPPRCGDGILQAPTEQCDNGDGVNSDAAYGPAACTASCGYGPYCGDGLDNGPTSETELCDNGAANGGYGLYSCTYECQPGPTCGDGTRNGPEECDVADPEDPTGGNCSDDCTILAYCGDGLVNQTDEDCDYGQFASDTYGGCTEACEWGLRCGDGTLTEPYEECDEGADNDDTEFNGCTTSCNLGPRCGDGVTQEDAVPAEACDNGFNEDTYAYDADSCGTGCTLPPEHCGDGILQVAHELCDEGEENVEVESAYGSTTCTTDCQYGSYCGDGILEPDHEVCDRGTLNGQEYGPTSCSYDCQLGPRCGDNIRNGSEECDGTSHCSSTCLIQGYCGDGLVATSNGEECDYGQFASEEYGSCTVTCNWGPNCGDGTPDERYEECDLGTPGNVGAYNGCSANCTLGPRCGDGETQAGEACDNGFNDDTYRTGAADECGTGCELPGAYCGDGVLEPAYEECDNGTANSNTAYGLTACSATCRFGAYCGDGVQNGTELCDRGILNGREYGPTSCGYDCQAGPRCGDGIRNGTEQCDGTAHCSSLCMLEPYCGDSVVRAGEECDYGRFASSSYGGCSAECKWGPRCGDGTVTAPYEECDAAAGNDDADYNGCTTSCIRGPHCGDGVLQTADGEACDNGFNDDVYRAGLAGECGDGCQLPLSHCGDGTLDLAYEDCDNGTANSNTAYGLAACTSTCRYGDYCGDGIQNGTEACDRGRLNGQEYGAGSCGYDCQPGPYCGDLIRNGTEECDGGEHCTTSCVLQAYCGDGLVASSAGEACDYGRFASNAYGSCTVGCKWGPNCGDGHLDTPYEECDLGAASNVNAYNGCSQSCKRGPRCGDGKVQAAAGETCDNGFNDDIYRTGAQGECGSGCQRPTAYCGDGVVEPAYEECDNGSANSSTAYGFTACTATCTLGAFCGDGVVTGSEVCDRGLSNGREYGANSCSYDCQVGPRCGDGIRNGAEQCDGTAHCSALCTLEPYCGDGVTGAGEECDYGQFASNAYGGCTNQCEWGPRCGDGTPDEPYEECDLGAAGNDGDYNGCTATCTLGPRCGDSVRQATEGEACDNGFNDDIYAYDQSACGSGCQLPPSCGDEELQTAFELCDQGEDNSDTAYNGCATTCIWGPYCGDGNVDPEETCDDGADNTVYSASGVGCSYDCELAPYCGDGVRNGPEECDNGAEGNIGGYGNCNANCTRAPRCGDLHRDAGEECDGGPVGSLTCTPACKVRAVAY